MCEKDTKRQHFRKLTWFFIFFMTSVEALSHFLHVALADHQVQGREGLRVARLKGVRSAGIGGGSPKWRGADKPCYLRLESWMILTMNIL